MANAPWARLTKPINPMVTESPTETMNSTVPADRPPSRIPAKLATKSTADPGAANGGRRAANSERRMGKAVSLLRPIRYLAISPTSARSLLGRARADAQHLALVLDVFDLGEVLFVK